MAEMCVEIGYVPTVCGSGEEALQAMASEGAHFPLVLCDVHLPGISGVDVLKQLRASNRP